MRIRLLIALLGTIVMVSMPVSSTAFPACDNFGQDWDIALGPFGTSFPFTMLVTGCRDCNESLGCGDQLPLDGTATISADTAGRIVTVFSMAAYDPSTSSCVTTNWNGFVRLGSLQVNGRVSNELGPFGNFSLNLATACASAPSRDADPARGGK